MLEGITVALQSYYDTATSAKNILDNALVQVRENYIGASLAEKTKEVQDVYNQTLDESRKTNYDACMEVLNGVEERVQEIVKVPVPADFPATLEALKQINNPSKTELETLVGAYRNNYYAYRAIRDYLKVPTPSFTIGRDTYLLTLDGIQEAILDIKDILHKCFFSDNVDGYHFLNIKDGTQISSYDALFTSFCDGRFEDIYVVDASGSEL